jgi:hypothetical protein
MERRKMKMTKNSMIAVLAATLLTPAVASMAQYQATGQDGVTASPKVRARLNERAAQLRAASITVASVNLIHSADDGIAASPKLRAQLDERKAASTLAVDTSPSTTRKSNDGIAASPKVRQQLHDRSSEQNEIQIAPIK